MGLYYNHFFFYFLLLTRIQPIPVAFGQFVAIIKVNVNIYNCWYLDWIFDIYYMFLIAGVYWILKSNASTFWDPYIA